MLLRRPLCQAVWPACRHRHWGVSNMLLPRSRGQPCWPNPSAPSPPYTTTCRSLQIHPARWFKIQCIVAPWVTYNIAAWHLPASCLSFPQIRNLSAPEIMLACCRSWTCTAVAPPRCVDVLPWALEVAADGPHSDPVRSIAVPIAHLSHFRSSAWPPTRNSSGRSETRSAS